MSGTKFYDEIIPPALGLALIADRVHEALWKLNMHEPLTERDQRALRDGEKELIQTHQSISKFVATRILGDCPSQYAVIYELVNQTLGHKICPFDYSGLERIAKLSQDLHSKINLEYLERFFGELYKNSMAYDPRPPIETISVG